MKNLILTSLIFVSSFAGAQTYVNPYVRSDGTYVQGHVRSAPNDTRMDNYGARDNIYGNTNPMTGQRGSQRSELTPYGTQSGGGHGGYGNSGTNSGGYRNNR